MDSILFSIWLNCCCTPGSLTFDLLRQEFSTPYEIYAADEVALRKAISRYDRDLRRLLNKDLEASRRILNFCHTARVRLLPYDSPEYPASLREIPSPPVLLYVKGNLPEMNNRFSVAMVGTRKMSDYGKRMTFEIARDLARAGAVVVSGLALGIDGVANAAAINGGGETVAVLGSGIDIIYPSSHAKLAEFVARHGAVITEFPPGTRPEGKNFPIRNRVISGLAQATAIMEGDLKSGSLITARYAKRQGRAVYAMPGRVDETGSEGPCMLLRNGAKIVTCADDILSDFEKTHADKINIFRLLEHSPYIMDKVLRSMGVFLKSSSRAERVARAHLLADSPAEAPVPEPVSPQEETRVKEILCEIGGRAAEVYAAVNGERGTIIDEIVEKGIPVSEAMVAVSRLEMNELLEVLPGGFLKRKQTST